MNIVKAPLPFLWRSLVLIAICLMTVLLPASLKGPHGEAGGEYLVTYGGKWNVLWGERKGDGSDNWIPFDTREKEKLKTYRGVYWLEKEMPKLETVDPNLLLLYAKSFEVYENDRLLFRYNMDNPDPYLNPYLTYQVVKLTPGSQPRDLAFKMIWDRHALPQNWNVIGNRYLIDRLTVQNDWVPAVFSIIFASASAAAFMVFVRRRQERLYLWFALITGCAGIGFFSMIVSLRLFLDLPVTRLQYFRDLLFPLAMFGLIGFMGNMLHGRYRRFYRWMGAAVLGYTAVAAVSSLTSPYLYSKLALEWAVIPFAAVFVLMSYTVLRSRASLVLRSNEEFKWLLLGYGVLILGACLHLINISADTLFGIDLERIMPMWTFLLILYGLQLSLLIFVGCLGMILLGRFSEVYRTLQHNAAELEAANRELGTLSRLKDDFLSHTSHELRTPLHGIAGLADALLDGAAGPVGGEMQRNLQLVRGSADRLLHLVNDILDMDRLRHGDIQLKLAEVDALGACETVAAALAPLAKRKGLQLSVERADVARGGERLTVLADSARLEQILYNLIGNAIRYTESGQVLVSAAREKEAVRIVISDSGSGISAERLEMLFEPFGAAASDYGGGMGLGLPITNRLVRLHGGELKLDSQLGIGTTASFLLPAAAGREKAADDGIVMTGARQLARAGMDAVSLATGRDDRGEAGNDGIETDSVLPVLPPDLGSYGEMHAGDRPASSTSGEERLPLILIADDQPVNLEVLRHYLRRSGYRLVETANGAEAAAWLEHNGKPDLMLLDVMMPGKTGYEVCRLARERWTAGELPIILLSAQNRLDRLTLGFDSGANDYLTKPFSQGELLARVDIQLKLAQFHLSLEELVRRRTEELEEANRHLAGSVKETAEALAEVSVLEERSRIAHDMHDLVGHSLTAAIVQIEAAKKLSDRDLPRSVERMNAAGEMIRKGLNDVRRTVRMLKDDEAGFDLQEALRELIRDSTGQADVLFEYRPDPLPPMGALAQKVVYHALMEGITNGLRHGRCGRFRFVLAEEGGLVRFELVSDGEPYGASKPGFGLSAMMERVHLLGGTVTIGEAEPGIGCRLVIMLPLEETGAKRPDLPA
ncbi:ATP-binding protein [Cohnella sp. GCM10020058]|uniref:ATP-binding protein n=1 Tax=Cohnella sp. GCM10020058 TaxID=3317330 RepID=UPI00362E176C